MDYFNVVWITICILGNTLLISGTTVGQTITNIQVTIYDLERYTLTWNPIKVQGDSKNAVLYTVRARVLVSDVWKDVTVNETHSATTDFNPDNPDGEKWYFTVIASSNGNEIARGMSIAYRGFRIPSVQVSLTPPTMSLSNHCGDITVNLSAPNPKMGGHFLKFYISAKSEGEDKSFLQNESVTKESQYSSRASKDLKAPSNASRVCVDSWYRVLVGDFITSPHQKLCVDRRCPGMPKVPGPSDVANYVLIVITLIAIFATSGLFYWICRKFMQKNGKVQLPETLKQVIGAKLREEIVMADMRQDEALPYIEPVEYEDEALQDDRLDSDDERHSDDGIEQNTGSTRQMQNSNRGSSLSETENNPLVDPESTPPPRSSNTYEPLSATVTNVSIHRINREVGGTTLTDYSLTAVPAQTDSFNVSSDYCEKNFAKQPLLDVVGNPDIPLHDCIDGGYILKTFH